MPLMFEERLTDIVEGTAKPSTMLNVGAIGNEVQLM